MSRGTMRRPRLDIEEWHQTKVASCVESVTPVKRWSPSGRAIGLVGTVLLHALLLQSALLGTHAHKLRPPDTQGLGAALIQSQAPPSETLILIDLPGANLSYKPLVEDLSSAGALVNSAVVALVSPDPLPHVDIAQDELSDEQDSAATIDSGDPAARAALFGRYTGQIDARIERAWRRPRSAVNSRAQTSSGSVGGSTGNEFKCLVRIIQDVHGNVQEVQMVSCKGSIAWQQSLVTAILAASPLPAPPNPSVFTQSLTMTFSAGGAVAGAYYGERAGASTYNNGFSPLDAPMAPPPPPAY